MLIESRETLDAFSGPGRCECCGRACERDPHHVFLKRGVGGGQRLDVPENIVAICRVPCHALAEADRTFNRGLKAIVAARVSKQAGRVVYGQEIIEWLWLVLRSKDMPDRPWERKVT